MGWAALVPLIIQFGVPLAEFLWNKIQSNSTPTEADWAQLKALANQTPVDLLKAQLVAKGVPLDSPQAVQLIALVS